MCPGLAGRLHHTVHQHAKMGEHTKGGRFQTDKRKLYFPQHVVNLGNSLPCDVMMTPGLNGDEKEIDGSLSLKNHDVLYNVWVLEVIYLWVPDAREWQ